MVVAASKEDLAEVWAAAAWAAAAWVVVEWAAAEWAVVGCSNELLPEFSKSN